MIPFTGLKHHNRQVLGDVIPLDKPYTLIVEPSSVCNFRCIQCFQSIDDDNYFARTRQVMSLACFEKVVAQMKNWEGPKLKVLKLSLYGEPFINPHFCEMLKIARHSAIAERIETTTNASLLTPEICEKLIEYGLDYMRVSVYSAYQERHERITKSNLGIMRIHDNLETLMRCKGRKNSDAPFVSVKMLDAYNEENASFLEMYGDVSDEAYLDKPHGWLPYKDKNYVKDLYGNDSEKAHQDMAANRSARKVCTLPFFTLAVRSNGDVSPCCIDWLGGTNLGSIGQYTLRELWNGEKMYEFRKMQLERRQAQNESCRSCEFYLSDYYTRDNIDDFPVDKLKPPTP
jgi:radical SAM protein with 4Fe4S-binding SPASM domain